MWALFACLCGIEHSAVSHTPPPTVSPCDIDIDFAAACAFDVTHPCCPVLSCCSRFRVRFELRLGCLAAAVQQAPRSLILEHHL